MFLVELEPLLLTSESTNLLLKNNPLPPKLMKPSIKLPSSKGNIGAIILIRV